MRTKTLEQKSADNLAGLQIDLLQRLRNGNMSFEQIEWFKNLSFEKRERLMGKINTEHQNMKLVDSKIVVTGLVGNFNPQQHFTENKNVKYWRGDDFNKHVLNPAKIINGFQDMSFSKHLFVGSITDSEIMRLQISESVGLMTREEILWVIASLTSKQPKGETGVLINDSYATIIGYMFCDDGVVRSVSVEWNSNSTTWCCYLHDPIGWGAGNNILSKNNSKKKV